MKKKTEPKEPKAPPTPSFVINKVKLTRKSVYISYTKVVDGNEEFGDIESRDNPLTSFSDSVAALAPVVCRIIEASAEYTKDLRVLGITMGSQGDADNVSILAHKSLSEAAKAFKIVTPTRLLQHPTEPGTYTPPLTKEEASAIYDVLSEAKAYLNGERAQGQLELDEEEVEEEGDSNTEQFPEVK
jgi:hypothetical protein